MARVERAYGGRRKIVWFEIFAGEKAARLYDGEYLPDETLAALLRFAVSIKGPLATPSGGGMRSLNVAIRQRLDLFACVRPVRYFAGVDSPLKNPEKMDVTVFRENTEDIYAGIEWEAQSEGARRGDRLFARRDGGDGDSLSGHFGDRHQADFARGIAPLDRQGRRLRAFSRPQKRDFGAQGEHYEVHRGRLYALGLRVGGGARGEDAGGRPVDDDAASGRRRVGD